MASTSALLPLAFAECLSERQVFAKLSNRRVNVSYSSASRWSSNSKRAYVKAVSTDRGGPQNAISIEELIETRSSELNENKQSTPSASKLVLVVGASGGVGQLVVASLLQRNVKSRLILRDPEKATTLFGKQDKEKLQVYKGDTRNHDDLDPSIFEGVTHVICCTGTTAFPSRRWDEDNTPERVDWMGVKNLVSALPSSVKRVVLVSSIGVTKFNELPWSIMNLFGVLKYKKMGEDFLRSSGLPFTIIRAGRLTDGPYTSYDLNTLLKATAGQRRAVLIGQGDKLVGEASRIIVAEACIQALDLEVTENQVYEVNSVEAYSFAHLHCVHFLCKLITVSVSILNPVFISSFSSENSNTHNQKNLRQARSTHTDLLKDTRKTTCKPASTPMDPNLKLGNAEEDAMIDREMYQCLVGD